MNPIVPLSRVPHRIVFSCRDLRGYRTAEQLSFALTALRLRTKMLSMQVPMSSICLDWPPPRAILGDYAKDSPEMKLYLILEETVGVCGFPVTALQDIEVFSHDPNATTVLELDRRRRLVAVQ